MMMMMMIAALSISSIGPMKWPFHGCLSVLQIGYHYQQCSYTGLPALTRNVHYFRLCRQGEVLLLWSGAVQVASRIRPLGATCSSHAFLSPRAVQGTELHWGGSSRGSKLHLTTCLVSISSDLIRIWMVDSSVPRFDSNQKVMLRTLALLCTQCMA